MAIADVRAGIGPRRRILLIAAVFMAALATVLGLALSSSVAAPSSSGPASQREPLDTLDNRGTEASATAFERLAVVAGRKGEVQVIAGLQTRFTPQGTLNSQQVGIQHATIARARRDLIRSLAGTRFSVVRTYKTVPFVALRLSSPALDALRQSGKAASLHEDTPQKPLLAQSTPLVEATETAAPTVSRTGTGQHLAILDSGIDKAHPFLQQGAGGLSKVVSEACYSFNRSCPNGQTSDTSAGAGVPCNYAPGGCRHGTHVAGIAAGRGASAGQPFSGVAPGAKLIAVQVFSRFTGDACAGAGEDPCPLSRPSDQIAGLERVLNLSTSLKIASVNMSLGAGVTNGHCDDNPLKPSIDNLLSAGVATVISAGNLGSNSGVGRPACISSAVTVGSTTDADTISCFSNSSSLVDLLAPGGRDPACDDPGTDILSSVPRGTGDGGSNYAAFHGTSMAAPHVAGAFAVMKSVVPTIDPFTTQSYLEQTGKPITDPYNGVSKPRIRVLSASVLLRDTGFKSAATLTYPGGDVASNGVGLSARRGGASRSGTISLSGIPADATIRRRYLYWMTIGGRDSTAFFNGASRNGELVGASRDTNWFINEQQPNRVYRAILPPAAVPGNGAYGISGVGRKDNGSDGQGASLVVVYSRAASSQTGKILVRHGAMTANSGETMSHTFTGLTVPTSPSGVNLHVGMGDGQSGLGGEDPMRFRGSPITPSNHFFGSDDPMWDDRNIAISTGLLPTGTTARTNGIHVLNDPLAWAYAALAYQHP
jgi:subtilisin family serine protease